MSKIINLSEEDAKKHYLELLPIFIKFINNDSTISSYCDPFDWSNVDKIHDNTVREYERNQMNDAVKEKRKDELTDIKNLLQIIKNRDINEIEKLKEKFEDLIDPKYSAFDMPVYDYCFRDGDTFYSLDISHDFEDFGFNHDYFLKTYPDQINNLYCCELNKHKEYIEPSDVKTSILFAYNNKTNEVVELLNVSNHSSLSNSFIRSTSDEIVLKKVLSNK